MFGGEKVDYHKADVMAGAAILIARVAESGDNPSILALRFESRLGSLGSAKSVKQAA